MSATKRMNVLFLSTYPPRECGIATFTQDIVRELLKSETTRPRVVALADEKLDYPGEVVADIRQSHRAAYMSGAEWINESGADVLMVEHEYGIFGGDTGEFLLDLLERLAIPYMITCHTVLPKPTFQQRQILSEACQGSSGVVVMSRLAKELLVELYDVPEELIIQIHHGVPNIAMPPRDELKKTMGFEGKTVVSTFGLLSPGKGLEYGIQAIAQVAKQHDDVRYLILGQTHPGVVRESGEEYRVRLTELVCSLGISKNVQFVNHYLGKEDIIRYLTLSDVYMTPYLNPDQAVSGTLAYAVGCGRVIVSTPYIYAREMLAGNRGILGEFRDAQSLADGILDVVESPMKKHRMENNTKRLGITMAWPCIAKQYEDALALARHQSAKDVFF